MASRANNNNVYKFDELNEITYYTIFFETLSRYCFSELLLTIFQHMLPRSFNATELLQVMLAIKNNGNTNKEHLSI